jgi:uncharacterized protein (TIGR02598 family)
MIVTFHHPRRPVSAGFSLVEVTLAVAIAALAIITLLGLMPQGLEMSRKTGILTINSNIIEQIIRDLENTQFNLLPAQGTGTSSGGGNSVPEKSRRYFNDQGQEVQQQSGQITFVAEIDFTQRASLPRTEQTQPFLRRVIIRVATTSNPDFQFGDNNRLAYTTFNHLLAKSR